MFLKLAGTSRVAYASLLTTLAKARQAPHTTAVPRGAQALIQGASSYYLYLQTQVAARGSLRVVLSAPVVGAKPRSGGWRETLHTTSPATLLSALGLPRLLRFQR